MALGARIVTRTGKAPKTTYRWDAETDILTGAVKGGTRPTDAAALTGSVELEGADGSFILLDVAEGVIRGVEVVVWPDVRTVGGLAAPTETVSAEVVLPGRPSTDAVAAVEVDTPLTIDTNPAESVFRVRVGPARHVTAALVAEGLVVEVDDHAEIAGLWLTGVPPFPADADADVL
jgi:hypothetical protein